MIGGTTLSRKLRLNLVAHDEIALMLFWSRTGDGVNIVLVRVVSQYWSSRISQRIDASSIIHRGSLRVKRHVNAILCARIQIYIINIKKNLTWTFKGVESIKDTSFVHWMINLSLDNAIVALSGWHLLLLISILRHLNHHRLSTEYTIRIIWYLCVLLLLEYFRIRDLSTHSHRSWCTSCNAMRILGAEDAIRYFDLAISKLLHPIVTCRLHCWLHGRRLLCLLIRHVLAGHVHLFYRASITKVMSLT